MTALVGQTLLRQFRVEAYLGSGGMGVVYRVWDLKRSVTLAMKVLHVDLAEDPSILKRFKREARALQKLAHPNIVPFYGLHQAGDITFLLERYIDGPSFKDILRQRKKKPMPVNDALIYMKSISSALGYAHAHDVVHCDVKPGNVMVDQGGSIYLTDFGVARHAESTTTTLGFAGTAAYMAPEQCRGDPVTAETDVYALGVMLFEMITGQRPFKGDERDTESGGATAAERVRYAHIHLEPPNPMDLNPKLPAPLVEVIMKALNKYPQERYSGSREFYEAACGAAGLNPLLIAERVKVPSRMKKAFAERAPTQSRVPVPYAAENTQALQLSISRNGILVVGAGVIIVAGLIYLLSLGGSSRDSSAEVMMKLTQQVIAANPTHTIQLPTQPPTPRATNASIQTPIPTPTMKMQFSDDVGGITWRPDPNCPQSRIHVGNWTRVTLIPPLPNRVRHEPSFDTGTVLGFAQPGEFLEVLEGPICNEILWWRVRTEGGIVGWTGEGDYDGFWLYPGDPFGPGLQDGGF